MTTPWGVIAASVTPFDEAGHVDLQAMRRHLDRLVSNGVHGLLVLGGTGETLGLDVHERADVVQTAVEAVGGRVPIYVGVFDPGLPQARLAARRAAGTGVTGLVALPPYYIKPSFDGVIEHFEALAAESGLPIIAYNNPGRIGWNMTCAHLVELAEAVPAIVGVKDCERDVASLSAKIDALGPDVALLSGDDDLGFATLLSGSPGGIWTTPNLAPTLCVQLFEACQAGDLSRALSLHRLVRDLMGGFFLANHPGPLKEVMEMAGVGVGAARPPLRPMAPVERERARLAIEKFIRDGVADSSVLPRR